MMETDSGTQLQVSATQEVSVSENTAYKKVSNMETKLLFLREKVEKQECEITGLKLEQLNIDTRLRAQERYTSKDSVLVWNPPFDARAVDYVTDAIIDLFRTSLKVNISRWGIKACHMYMGKYGNNMPTIIGKFVYFDDKHAVYKARSNLKYQKNILNKRNIYITERLPDQEAIIKKAANDMDLITTTHNCIVSVLVHDEKLQGETKFMRVDAVDETPTLVMTTMKGNPLQTKKPTH